MSPTANAKVIPSRESERYFPGDKQRVKKPVIKPVGREEIRALEAIHQSTKLFATSLAILMSAMAMVIAFNSVLSSKQVKLDIIGQQLNKQVISNQNLNLEKADLQSPARILKIATTNLKMSYPSQITYLQKVNPYASVTVAGLAATGHSGKDTKVKFRKNISVLVKGGK